MSFSQFVFNITFFLQKKVGLLDALLKYSYLLQKYKNIKIKVWLKIYILKPKQIHLWAIKSKIIVDASIF